MEQVAEDTSAPTAGPRQIKLRQLPWDVILHITDFLDPRSFVCL